MTYQVSTAEKIETIVLTRKSGQMGLFHPLADGSYLVIADGKLVNVRTTASDHWSVTVDGFEGLDSDLLEAAHLALLG